jgi:hypothetical protein
MDFLSNHIIEKLIKNAKPPYSLYVKIHNFQNDKTLFLEYNNLFEFDKLPLFYDIVNNQKTLYYLNDFNNDYYINFDFKFISNNNYNIIFFRSDMISDCLIL